MSSFIKIIKIDCGSAAQKRPAEPAAPTPSGHVLVSLSSGHVLDEWGTATHNVAAVL